MSQVYALLVGINEYPSPVRNLRGCIRDIEDVHRYLTQATGSRQVRTLINEQATHEAVVDGIREHLGRAGPGDTALFWFSGHGSTAKLPPDWWHLEPNGGTMHTLVCADSRGPGRPRDLLDKHFNILIRAVAARGAHVVTVLDCCHAGGAVRSVPDSVGERWTKPAEELPDPVSLSRGTDAREVAASGDSAWGDEFVALGACQGHELAHEAPDGDEGYRGLFSRGLLAELRQAGPVRTYRELLASARGYVENLIDSQTPVLEPSASSIVDQPFLGGRARPPVTTMTMSHRRGQWIVDAGSAHGLDLLGRSADRIGSGDAGLVTLAVHGPGPVREARVDRVLPDHSAVVPIEWEPDAGRTYPVVLSRVPLPATTVSFGADKNDDPRIAREVEAAIRSGGPAGGPSPHLRVIPFNSSGDPAELLVGTPASGAITVHRMGGTLLASARPGPGRGYGEAVAVLEHIARWRRIRTLANPASGLQDRVRLEIIQPEPREARTPRDRPGIRPSGTTTFEFEYTYGRNGCRPPSVFMRLDNTADRRLFCVLLDLTDRFRIHAGLFPGEFVEAGSSAAVARGGLIDIALPATREVPAGAEVTDWLMLIVTEDRINSDHFAMAPLGELSRERTRSAGLSHVVERLALRAHYRDVESRPSAASDWWTSVTKIVTRVPGPVSLARNDEGDR